MSDLVTRRSDVGLVSREVSAMIGEINYTSQQSLLLQLEDAFRASGKSVDEVARVLGVPDDLVREVLEGDRELTLTEIRHFAYAVDAVVHYRVTSRARQFIEWLLESREAAADHQVWKQSGDFSATPITTFESA